MMNLNLLKMKNKTFLTTFVRVNFFDGDVGEEFMATEAALTIPTVVSTRLRFFSTDFV